MSAGEEQVDDVSNNYVGDNNKIKIWSNYRIVSLILFEKSDFRQDLHTLPNSCMPNQHLVGM